MVIRWGVFYTKSRTALKTGWLITAGVIALYLGVIQPRDQARGIASQKASGIAAVSGGVGWEPISLWRQTSILPHLRSEGYLQNFKKALLGAFPWTVPLSHPPLSLHFQEDVPAERKTRRRTVG